MTDSLVNSNFGTKQKEILHVFLLLPELSARKLQVMEKVHLRPNNVNFQIHIPILTTSVMAERT